MPQDTIVANDSIVDAFKASRDYDYARELMPTSHEDNYFDKLWRSIEDLFDIPVSIGDIPIRVWWLLGAIALMAVAFLIWKHRAALFGPRDASDEEQDITEDDINEVEDFDQLIAEAERNGDYLRVCRLRYLQTLKAASDASLVTWRRYKTPMQYAMEWNDEDFSIMTRHFLRIRYGHYTADAALAEEMRSLQQAVQARIASSAGQPKPTGGEQEGGVQP